jgi:Xaa-Pro aminopeptidase
MTSDQATEELTEEQQLRRELVAEKHAQAVGLLNKHEIDCWLTFTREGSDLLLPFVIGGEYTAGISALLLFANGPSVAIVADYDVGQVNGIFDQVIPYSLDWKEPFQTVLRERNPTKIGINYSEHDHGMDGLTHGLYLLLQSALAPLGFADRLVSSEPIAATARAVKTPAEIERIRRACEITQRIFDDLTGMLKPGLTEGDIADIIRERMQTYEVGPSWEAALCPAVFSTKSQPGHAPPSATKIERGDGVRVDFGVFYEGYASDMQRTWYLLNPGETDAPDAMRHAHDTVRDGILLAASLLKPGVTGVEVDRPVRQFIADRGYTFTHATGHQLGRLVHDGGMVLGPDNARYGERSRGIVEAGMVFTLEPVVASAMIEDDVVVTESGCEFMSPTQQSIYLVS